MLNFTGPSKDPNRLYIPNPNFNGTDSFTFRTYDGLSYSNVATVFITVNAVNDAPTISGTPGTTAGVGWPYSFTPTASDVDGNTRTFSVVNLPAWASFTTTTGTLAGTAAVVGSYAGIQICVTDGVIVAPVCMPEFSIQVNATNVTAFTATAGNGLVQLSWINPIAANLVGVKVLARADGVFPSGPEDLAAEVLFNGSGTEVVHGGLANGTEYRYAAYAHDSVPTFGPGAQASAMPLHAPVAIAGAVLNGLALKSDGTVWTWGANWIGQLGDGTIIDRTSPVLVCATYTTSCTEYLTGVIAITGGGFHNLALKSDGTVWAWGYNAYGQLGDGTATDRLTPVQVQGLTGVSAIAGGVFHSMALKSDGTVWTWGANGIGQLGDGTATDRLTPVQVQGLTGVSAIAGGREHSLALKSDGTAWAWGSNVYGQLSDASCLGFADRLTPVQVQGLTGVIAITGGGKHSLALKSDGTAWAWGWNADGQLGDGTFTNHCTAVQVQGLTGIMAVAGGEDHSLALKSDGTVWAWGYNAYGQLGDGTATDRLTPVQVQGLTGASAIAGAFHDSLALKSDGTVWAWGYNAYGQLGDGTTVNTYTPVQSGPFD
jgi:alpha-tubulin suppressor-like RCC1 family protein